MTDFNTIKALKLIKIAKHYRLNNQLVKATEEFAELIQVVAKYRQTKDKKLIKAIMSEIVDCHIMMAQLVFLIDIKTEALEKEIMFKLDREIERIEEDVLQNNAKNKEKM